MSELAKRPSEPVAFEVVEGELIDVYYCWRCGGTHGVLDGLMRCCCGEEHGPDWCCRDNCGHFHDLPPCPQGPCGNFRCCIN